MALKLKIGSPVAGEDFFGRNAELRKAETLIEDNNLMLAAPRRVGKTSFAKRLMEVQSSKGWNTIFIDLEEITNTEHFFKAFYDELMALPEAKLKDKITSGLKKWLSGVEISTANLPVKATVKIGAPSNDDFKELAEVLNMLDNHTLIVFDELTVLLESLSALNDGDQMVRTFLNQFRALRSATTEKCSWLICSSVGVRNFTTQHNLSDTINDDNQNEEDGFYHKLKDSMEQRIKNGGQNILIVTGMIRPGQLDMPEFKENAGFNALNDAEKQRVAKAFSYRDGDRISVSALAMLNFYREKGKQEEFLNRTKETNSEGQDNWYINIDPEFEGEQRAGHCECKDWTSEDFLRYAELAEDIKEEVLKASIDLFAEPDKYRIMDTTIADFAANAKNHPLGNPVQDEMRFVGL